MTVGFSPATIPASALYRSRLAVADHRFAAVPAARAWWGPCSRWPTFRRPLNVAVLTADGIDTFFAQERLRLWLLVWTHPGPAARWRLLGHAHSEARAALAAPVEPPSGNGAREQIALDGHPGKLVHFPQRLSQPEFYAAAYPLMLLSRRMEERLLELFQKGYVKGTVTMSAGNEATAVGMAMPLRPGRDVVSLLHRDFAGHLLLGRHAVPVVLPVHGQRREPDARPRGQRPSRRRRRADACR